MRFRSLPLVVVAAYAALAGACPELPVLPEGRNQFDLQYGATNANAALGSGALSAVFSKCGELTVLKWPGPSYYNQLNYQSSNAPDARLLPRFGALETHGAFAGLAFRTRGGGRGVTWFRDDAWTHSQRYTAETSNVLEDVAVNAALGLRVVAWHFVLPERNVLVSHFEVRREPRSPVRHATLLFYSNFAPTKNRLLFFPFADWALDHENDFAILYDRRARALLHFLPDSAKDYPHDFSVVNGLLQNPPRSMRRLRREATRLAATLDEPGVYIAIGARRRDHGYQAGFDEAPACAHQSALARRAIAAFDLPPAFAALAGSLFVCDARIPDPPGPLGTCRRQNGWTHSAESAYADAQDGTLSGSPIAACQANGALARRLAFRKDVATATVYVAVGGTRAEAYALLDEARTADPLALRAATERWWADWLAPARLPATDDPLVTAFARRSLIVIRTATDNASGGIVASVNTQSPYGADWPRDGAFINHALDLAGYVDVVSRHNRFYARVQRKTPGPWSILYDFGPCDPENPTYPACVPAGTFETNYYTDPDEVVPANPISFEIDQAGLGVWTMWDHAQYLVDPAARRAYLLDVCPAIRRGAATLATCKDPSNNLQCFANEDDTIPLTQGLQGAETVLLGLRSAVAAGPDCGFDPAEVGAWAARADELAQAIRDNFLVPGPPARFEGGERQAWLLWPVEYFAPGDPVATSHGEFLHREYVAPVLARAATGGGYNVENLLARAKWFRKIGDTASLAALQDQVRFFVKELTTPGTLHLAEVFHRVPLDLNGDGITPDYLPENDIPHVWQHAYLYATAMTVFGAR